MKKVDQNNVVLAGKVAFAESKQRTPTFCTGSVKLILNESGDTVWVNFTLNVDKNRNEKVEFDKLFTKGREVILSECFMGGYFKDKANKKDWRFQLVARMSGCGLAPGHLNKATVSGTVTRKGAGPNGSAGLVIDALYHAKKATPPWRNRSIKVLAPADPVKDQNIGVGDRVFVTGQVDQGKEPYIRAETIAKVQG